jgi:hypothetical protein
VSSTSHSQKKRPSDVSKVARWILWQKRYLEVISGDTNPETGNKLVIRVDDTDVEKIHKRFAWYSTDIVPLLDSWKADGVEYYTIDGEQLVK